MAATLCLAARTPTLKATPAKIVTQTARLYGGDLRVRIRQELLLGVGGVKELAALGIVPGVLHLNEGTQRLSRQLRNDGTNVCSQGISPEKRPGSASPVRAVFTTHTPVPAGHDCFPAP